MVHLKSVPGVLLPLAVPGVDSQGREEGRRRMRQGATPRGLDIKGHGWETLPLMPRVFSPVARVPGLEMGWVSKSCVSIFPHSAGPVTPYELTTPRGLKRATLGSWTQSTLILQLLPPWPVSWSMGDTQPAPQMQTNPT